MKPLGIDTGTTTLVASTFDGNSFHSLAPQSSPNGIRSVAYYNESIGLVFGNAALRWGLQNPNASIADDFKRRIDQKKLTVGGKEFESSEVLSGMITHLVEESYKKVDNDLFEISEENAQDENLYCVFTFPTNLGKGKDQRIKDIILHNNMSINTAYGNKTIKMIGSIQEPYAAGIYYLKARDIEKGTVLVYDLGGGTLDVAVVNVEIDGNDVKYDIPIANGIRGLAVAGNDYDEKLKEIVLSKLAADGNCVNENAMDTFMLDVNTLKHDLTSMQEALFTSNALKQRKNYVVTRKEFEDATKKLLDDSINVVKEVVEDCKRANVSIDDIILVGGSCNMPMVKQNMIASFPQFRCNVFAPAHAISFGAAYYGDLIVNRCGGNFEMLDSLSNGGSDTVDLQTQVTRRLGAFYGTDVVVNGRKYVDILLEKGSKLPVESPIKTYNLVKEYQDSVSTSIYQFSEKKPVSAGRNYVDIAHADKFKSSSYNIKNPTRNKASIKFRVSVDMLEQVHVYVIENGKKEELADEFNLRDM